MINLFIMLSAILKEDLANEHNGLKRTSTNKTTNKENGFSNSLTSSNDSKNEKAIWEIILFVFVISSFWNVFFKVVQQNVITDLYIVPCREFSRIMKENIENQDNQEFEEQGLIDQRNTQYIELQQIDVGEDQPNNNSEEQGLIDQRNTIIEMPMTRIKKIKKIVKKIKEFMIENILFLKFFKSYYLFVFVVFFTIFELHYFFPYLEHWNKINILSTIIINAIIVSITIFLAIMSGIRTIQEYIETDIDLYESLKQDANKFLMIAIVISAILVFFLSCYIYRNEERQWTNFNITLESQKNILLKSMISTVFIVSFTFLIYKCDSFLFLKKYNLDKFIKKCESEILIFLILFAIIKNYN